MSGSARDKLPGERRQFASIATKGILPYALLAVLAVTSVKLRTVSLGSHYVTIAVCVLAALWMLFMHALQPPRRRAALMPVFTAGLIAITVGRRRVWQQGDGGAAVHQRGHGEDPPAAHLRQAWRR